MLGHPRIHVASSIAGPLPAEVDRFQVQNLTRNSSFNPLTFSCRLILSWWGVTLPWLSWFPWLHLLFPRRLPSFLSLENLLFHLTSPFLIAIDLETHWVPPSSRNVLCSRIHRLRASWPFAGSPRYTLNNIRVADLIISFVCYSLPLAHISSVLRHWLIWFTIASSPALISTPAHHHASPPSDQACGSQ